jgi:two-component system heavy metal sensor histidine kinase CusS
LSAGLAKPLRQHYRTSLAVRLSALFAGATAVLLLALGTGLGLMLRQQLEARDREEIDGKTEVVVHLLNELRTSDRIEQQVNRMADIVIGHPHLLIGLREGDEWLVNPTAHVGDVGAFSAQPDVPLAPALKTYELHGERWWVRRVQYRTAEGRVFDAYVGLHVNPAQVLVERFFLTLIVTGVLGVATSALLGWVVARRGLAPLQQIGADAERLTADRLGTPLRSEDAPAEVRGLVASINVMLERLQSSFRALEEFSADIAHELRTPINNMLLQSQVTLSRPRTAGEYQEALHSNLQELEHLQRTVSDMLFLARADRGMVSLKWETVDLAAEAKSLAEFFELAAAEDGKRIEVTGSASVHCDRLMARRAMTNLLSNAVRYAPSSDCIRIVVSGSAGKASVCVTNAAAALDTHALERLFGRFARGGLDTAGDIDGAGLGLSIVASIMRLHGGTVAARSSDGALTFCLDFTAEQPLAQMSKRDGAV